MSEDEQTYKSAGKSEKELQHQLIMQFGQQYPQYRDLLFEVNNDTYNQRHAAKRKSMGMVAGVSDLILVSPYTGNVHPIELKAPGSRHKATHIARQITWQRQIRSAGGVAIISANFDRVYAFIVSILNDDIQNAAIIADTERNIVLRKLDKGQATIAF